MRCLLALLTFCVFAAPALAHAQVCASLAADDGLPEAERAAALALIEAELQVRGLGEPGALDCESILVVRHIILGGVYNVVVDGPQGTFRTVADSAGELGSAYAELVSLALNGPQPEPELHAEPEPEPEPEPQPQPQPMYLVPEGWQLDPATGELTQIGAPAPAPPPDITRRSGPGKDFGYFRLGPGATVADGSVFGGPAIGFGWRHYESHLAVDASVANTFVLRDAASGFTMGIVSMNFYYLPRPTAASSAYFGGGMSWGIARVCTEFDEAFDDDRCFRGDGLQLEVGGGFEFLRHSSLRLATHLGVSLPMGTTAATNQWGDARPGPSEYVPTAALTVVIGLGGRCLDCEDPPPVVEPTALGELGVRP